MQRRVVYTQQAVGQIDVADLWWRLNRPAAARTVQDEVNRATAMLVVHPALGRTVPRSGGLRRCLLRATSYWLYYRATDDTIEVIRLLHVRRRPRRL